MTTETNVQNLKINTMTQAQYATITPSATELYMVTDSGSNYAFNNMSNVDSTGKKAVANWGCPDYSAGISMGLPTNPVDSDTHTYTCPSAGTCVVCVQKTTYGGNILVDVNNANVMTSVAYTAVGTSSVFPVSKNDVVRIYTLYAGNNDWTVTKQDFYPLRGEV